MFKAQIIGRLTRDPEMRYLDSGVAVCTLNLASNTVTGTGDNRKEVTDWVRVTLWRQQAENAANYLAKGREVYVEGYFNSDNGNPRTFTRSDGTPGASYEVTATQIQYLGGRGESSEAASEPTSAPATDDIPF